MQIYIENRIKRNPNNIEILRNSIPVICFGNLLNSRVATLGLNPSDKKFVDNNKDFLSGEYLRFQNCFSLFQNDLTKLNSNQTELVLQYCLEYFNNPNPYEEWFDILEKYILNRLEISYYDGTCCHLDLVQWATSNKWRDVESTNRSILLNSDFPFLLQQLDNQDIRLLLINGNVVFRTLKEKGEISNEVKVTIKSGTETCQMIRFLLKVGNKKVRGIAWSKNLQSSMGLTNNMRNEIGNWVKNHLL